MQFLKQLLIFDLIFFEQRYFLQNLTFEISSEEYLELTSRHENYLNLLFI